MNDQDVISVFVDESGNFEDLKDPARYCIVTLVLHNQTSDISKYIAELDRANEDLGMDPERFQFHAGPLIRQEGMCAALSRRQRARLFDRMMTFVRNVDFRYISFCVDTQFVNTPEQIHEKLKREMLEFFAVHKEVFESMGRINLYYDAGQKSVTRLLRTTLAHSFACPVEIVDGVRQVDYKLLQVADLVCTVELMAKRLAENLPLTLSEIRMFGGPRDFKRNILKKIKMKQLK